MHTAIKEITRLVKLNWICKDEEKSERKILRLKYGKIALAFILPILGFLLSVFGCIFALLMLITGLIPPYHTLTFFTIIFSITYLTLLAPYTKKYLPKRWIGWPIVIIKGIFLLIGSGLLGLHIYYSEQTKIQQKLEKMAAMTPEERVAFELQEKEIANNKYELEIANTKAKKQLEVDANDAKERQKDIEIENKNQQSFYDKLGSPKILYQCEGDDMIIAIGANYGTINRLLQTAQEKCAPKDFKILSKKE